MSRLRRQHATVPSLLEARVANPAPEALTVTVDWFDGDEIGMRQEWETAWWAPLADAVPARGDRCLALLSDAGRLWVVAGAWTGEP